MGMTIAQALKRIKRIKGDLSDLSGKIMLNLYIEVIESDGKKTEVANLHYDPVKLHNDRRLKAVEIANLKNRLATTNVSTYVQIPTGDGSEESSINTLILRMANAREDLALLRAISSQEPGRRNVFAVKNTSAVTTYVERYPTTIIDDDIKAMEDWIETLDTILQKVNHTTELMG